MNLFATRWFCSLLLGGLGIDPSFGAELPTPHPWLLNSETVRDDVTLVRGLPGITQPIQQAVLAAPTNDHLAVLWVKEGDDVAVGQPLGSLDVRSLRAELQLAEATAGRGAMLERAKKELAFAQHTLERTKKLKQGNATSQSQVDRDTTALELADSRLKELAEEQREAELRTASVKMSIEVRQLVAPFSGSVIRISARPGETPGVGEPIMTIANTDRLKVELHLPLEWFHKIEVGTTYSLWGGMPVQDEIDAVLTSKEPIVHAATGTFRCVFEIDNSTKQHPAGYAVRFVDRTKGRLPREP